MAVLPFVSVSALAVMKLNQTRTARANEASSKASGLAYSAVANLRTVLSLNAVPRMIALYQEATTEAYQIVVRALWKPALASGSMAFSFTIQQCILALYGAYLIYSQVSQTGCDPSGSVSVAGSTTTTTTTTCTNSGASVFGAMLGKFLFLLRCNIYL